MRLVGVLDEINNALNTVENKIQKKKELENYIILDIPLFYRGFDTK